MLIEKGYPLIDTDLIAREIVQPNKKAYNEIVKEFGREILDDNQELDRKKLGEIIFNDETKRKRLNSIMHPIIRYEVCKKIFFSYLLGKKLIFIDVPLLYESKSLLNLVQKVIVVNCERDQQLERIIKRNQLSKEEAESRINSQMDLGKKCELADFVIDNTKDLDNLKSNLDNVLNKIMKSNLHFKNLTIFRIIFFTSVASIGFSFYKLAIFLAGFLF